MPEAETRASGALPIATNVEYWGRIVNAPGNDSPPAGYSLHRPKINVQLQQSQQLAQELARLRTNLGQPSDTRSHAFPLD